MGARMKRHLLSGAVLGAALLGVVASEGPDEYDWRYPCNGVEGYDPAGVLYLHWAYRSSLDTDVPGFAEHIRLEDEHGGSVPLLLSPQGHGFLVLCPEGGLQADTSYTWTVARTASSYNHTDIPDHALAGAWGLHTGPATERSAIPGHDACDAHVPLAPVKRARREQCDPCTGDDHWGSCEDHRKRQTRSEGDTG
jgi:hypothetical protein